MNDEEVIEILDDLEDNTILIKPIKNVNIGLHKEEVVPYNNSAQSSEQQNLENNVPKEIKTMPEANTVPKKLNDVQYEPIKVQKEEITIEAANNDEDDSKSGLGFVIVLFILLAAFILALPYITKLF